MLSLYIVYVFEHFQYLVIAKSEVSAKSFVTAYQGQGQPKLQWQLNDITDCKLVSIYNGPHSEGEILMISSYNN